MDIFLAYANSPYVVAGFAGLTLLLLIIVIYLHIRVSRLTRGEQGKSLEHIIKDCLEHITELKKHDELISEHALKLDNRLSQSVRNVSALRFRAFDQNSSNQSFAVAFLNEQGDGVILSSLHHREHMSVFAKPVTNYTSTYDLSEEEQQVLEESKKAHQNSQ